MLESGARAFVASSLADQALRTRDEQQLLFQSRYHGVEKSFQDAEPLWRELRRVRECIVGGRHESDPLPDVYAAALSMRMGGDWNLEKDRSIYRGQRCASWKVVPSLFRPERDGAAPDVPARWRRTIAFSAAVHSEFPTLSDDQCLAVVQHYSAKDEADTPTHLIDVTWEPLVALFFASLGGVQGDLGIVDHIVVPEWRRLVAAESGDPGAIRVIEVTVSQRILRQRALFLVTPDPDLYERYVPYRIWFKQVEGLLFEDADVGPPITRGNLFPADEPMEILMKAFRRSASEEMQVLSTQPPRRSLLDVETLRQRALAMEPRLTQRDPYHDAVLQVVCEMLSKGPQWAKDNNPSKYSLHRLDECTRTLVQAIETGRHCGVEEALQFTLSRIDATEQDHLISLAHSTWVALHAVPMEVIEAELARLVEVVSPLRTKLAGLAFSGSEAHVSGVLRHLTEDPRWYVVDARGVSDAELARSLARAPQPQSVIVAVDTLGSLRTPVRLLLKAILDHKEHVELLGERPVPIHPASTWIIACGGSAAFQERREVTDRVPYWVDVDQFHLPS